MPAFKIFTESKADVKFIRDFVGTLFGISLVDEDFDTLGSWSGYKAGGSLEDSILENHDNGKQTILILDADSNYSQRQSEVLTDFAGYEIPIHLFLFPNNADNGNLEDLLSNIAGDKKLIECFGRYEHCIQGYQLPVSKARIFAYLDALLPAKNKKNDSRDLLQPQNRNYSNPAHWDLHHEYLNPLQDFLKQFFPNNP